MVAFAELGQVSLADNDLSQVLTRVAELARAVIAGAEDVSVTLVRGGVASTIASTGALALQLDERQYAEDHGPCLTAADQTTAVLIDDMASEERWPAFTADAVRHGARSSLSVGIPLGEQISGAINIYATQPGAYDPGAVALARTFAHYAAVGITNAHLQESTAALADQMSQAMASRAVIEQAKGVLMAQRGIDAAAAFEVLSAGSQRTNVKLRDLAQRIADGVSTPPQAPAPTPRRPPVS